MVKENKKAKKVGDGMAKDFLGNELKVGDTVVFMQIRYRSLVKGTVKSLSPQKALIEHRPISGSYSTQSRQFHDQMVGV